MAPPNPLPVILTVGKVAVGLWGAATVLNALAYKQFIARKDFARLDDPFEDPGDPDTVLAHFAVDKPIASDGSGEGFFFGLATAPAHVEDELDDAWLEFAEESVPEKEMVQYGTSDNMEEHGPGGSNIEGESEARSKGLSSSDGAHATLAKEDGNSSKQPNGVAAEDNEDNLPIGQGLKGLTADGEALAVAAFHNVPKPEQRLKFWSEPDTELQLAAGANVSVFRMGIDWGRIVPDEPAEGTAQVFDKKAVAHYRWILRRVRHYKMKVMLTLFHHSLPKWATNYGGWTNHRTVDYFVEFTHLAVEAFGDLVDYWMTFNEPHVFVGLTYCGASWPGGTPPGVIETLMLSTPWGRFQKAMRYMAEAHIKAYDIIHKDDETPGGPVHAARGAPQVGIAHHVSFMRPYGLKDVGPVVASNAMTRFNWVDKVCHKLDYIGINYYGQEVLSAPGLKLVPDIEYSEAGRGVYPDGMYRMLLQFHERYKHLKIRYIIAENGIADETDVIRRPYMIEHLLAIKAAIHDGVPIDGYFHWTLSDNWEWADGYGPKFGLVAVDRENDLKRTPRPSYHLYGQIAKTGTVTQGMREQAWNELLQAADEGKTRKFCREVDGWGLMYAGGLDCPTERAYVTRDWRFAHYEYEGLQDPVSRFTRFLGSKLPFRRADPARPAADLPKNG